MLREADILSCDQGGNGQVSFGYRDSSSGKIQVGTSSGADFLHPNKKGLIALLHLVLRITPLKRPAGRNTPAGVSLPLLRQASAGDPAAHRPQRRPTTRH